MTLFVETSDVASVKRRKITNAGICVGQPKRKTLGIRYAEVLRLRRAVAQALSQGKRPPQAERHQPQ
jgi:hypothetical protein